MHGVFRYRVLVSGKRIGCGKAGTGVEPGADDLVEVDAVQLPAAGLVVFAVVPGVSVFSVPRAAGGDVDNSAVIARKSPSTRPPAVDLSRRPLTSTS